MVRETKFRSDCCHTLHKFQLVQTNLSGNWSFGLKVPAKKGMLAPCPKKAVSVAKLTAAGSVNHAPLLMKSEGFQRFSVLVRGTDLSEKFASLTDFI